MSIGSVRGYMNVSGMACDGGGMNESMYVSRYNENVSGG